MICVYLCKQFPCMSSFSFPSPKFPCPNFVAYRRFQLLTHFDSGIFSGLDWLGISPLELIPLNHSWVLARGMLEDLFFWYIKNFCI